MSAFDESQHDRDRAGRFTEMGGSEQDDALTSAPTAPVSDPFEWVAGVPVSDHAREAYAGVHTFAGIDETYRNLLRPSGEPSFAENLDYTWAAVLHGSMLRRAGVATVPTSLDRSFFGECQNDAELAFQWSQAAEMIGEATAEAGRAHAARMSHRYRADFQARREELLVAGAVTGSPLAR